MQALGKFRRFICFIFYFIYFFTLKLFVFWFKYNILAQGSTRALFHDCGSHSQGSQLS